jgi:hypothetical protein
MQQIQNLELYVLHAKGFIKYEGEWPNSLVANTWFGVIL